MPKALEGINWDEIRNCYLREDVSIRELAERFGVAQTTLQQRSARMKWKPEKDMIEQSRSKVVSRISEKVVEKTSSLAATQIASHLERVLTSGGGLLEKLEAKLLTAVLPDITRFDHVESATRSYRSWDDLVRRAHGISDPRQGVDVTTNGESLHSRSLQILQSCQKLVLEGKANADAIDIEGLVKRMADDDKPDKV